MPPSRGSRRRNRLAFEARMTKAQRNVLILLGTLVAITLLSVIWANVFSHNDEIKDNFAKWGLGAVVAEIIGLFVFVVRGIFRQRTYTITLGPPKDMPGFDVSR